MGVLQEYKKIRALTNEMIKDMIANGMITKEEAERLGRESQEEKVYAVTEMDEQGKVNKEPVDKELNTTEPY